RKRLFEVALLHRGQSTIHHDEPDILYADERGELINLTFADKSRGANLPERDDLAGNGFKANRLSEAERLAQTRCWSAPLPKGSRQGRQAVRGAVAIGANHDRSRPRFNAPLLVLSAGAGFYCGYTTLREKLYARSPLMICWRRRGDQNWTPSALLISRSAIIGSRRAFGRRSYSPGWPAASSLGSNS